MTSTSQRGRRLFCHHHGGRLDGLAFPSLPGRKPDALPYLFGAFLARKPLGANGANGGDVFLAQGPLGANGANGVNGANGGDAFLAREPLGANGANGGDAGAFGWSGDAFLAFGWSGDAFLAREPLGANGAFGWGGDANRGATDGARGANVRKRCQG